MLVGLALTSHDDTALASATFAPEKVERVLMNLLTNALRHTPSDGAVEEQRELLGRQRQGPVSRGDRGLAHRLGDAVGGEVAEAVEPRLAFELEGPGDGAVDRNAGALVIVAEQPRDGDRERGVDERGA